MNRDFLKCALDLVTSSLLDPAFHYEADALDDWSEMVIWVWMADTNWMWAMGCRDWTPIAHIHLASRKDGPGVEITCTLAKDRERSPLPAMSPSVMRVVDKVWTSAFTLVTLLNVQLNGTRP